jgi:hypothetical protein
MLTMPNKLKYSQFGANLEISITPSNKARYPDVLLYVYLMAFPSSHKLEK